ncbi:hypothetical protein FRX31_012248 [Thalictrum thalictroides]|uniref:RNase H type-1 domain-containing protein n=1 Tax=Thalictrum thalictroides TaxID=46969 RepID=A0A7J6WLB9_THATH|nr:hypothetical protein FRX31_012248 [Thalictrum thalictroides]
MAIAKQIDYEVDRQFSPQQLQIFEQEYINAKLVPPSIWISPKTGFYKINVDIAYLNASNCIGIGYVVRNALGAFIIAGTESEHVGSAKEGECRGILQADRA